jgi:hypothetical protein
MAIALNSIVSSLEVPYRHVVEIPFYNTMNLYWTCDFSSNPNEGFGFLFLICFAGFSFFGRPLKHF